ncbi:TIGR02530 family flagellar biosynthesis protein [Herbivorax sp. ANBcel31]|uniref:TIGR02530 family flagellar biosynthesis protein n=1 Tax=Herbivorax sp. ANBcel31 TaxID=3069754 RepID=UPI0027AF48B0|nr:TIGR02530 family flagellar biosynthesis protein [Herbivorax sp. ANBcel31]MDQ2085889.1 TIGR02530 family flagellar biosynthesis protein [Herbivorax sp. ANBcel31]
MIINNNYYANVGRISPQKKTDLPKRPDNKQTGSFNEIFKSKSDKNVEVTFSKHARDRLESREIKLTNMQKEKISKAVQRANDKGVKESLVLVDDMAFVVSVKNRTVITALNNGELKENVFTNIDGAVIA